MINGVGNAELYCVYKGPVVPLQSLHTIAVTIKLMSLFLRTAQASCKTQQIISWSIHYYYLGNARSISKVKGQFAFCYTVQAMCSVLNNCWYDFGISLGWGKLGSMDAYLLYITSG